jgi:AcrR family transcriptional regulator
LRDEILIATEELLLKTGSAEAVSIRAVAEAVGVTAPSIYRHFPDKTTLIFEVCARYFRALDDAIDAAVAGIDDPILALKARATAYVHFGRDNPEPYRIMFMLRPEESPSHVMDDWVMHSRTYDDLMTNVQACIDAGRFQEGYDDASRICLGFWARVHGLVSLMISKPFLPWSQDDFIDQYLGSCLYGIAAH